MSTNFTDRSYPPVGEQMRYQRGDGAVVTLRVDNPDESPPPVVSAPVPATAPPPPKKGPRRVTTRATVPASMLPKLLGKPEGRGPNRPTAIATKPGAIGQIADDKVLDHPDVGGKFTICALFYGGDEYHELHAKCLNSIISTVPKERMDLRVGSNQLGAKSLALIQQHTDSGAISKHYRHDVNVYKYPVMREMFHDPEHPITTKWVIWFDDDSIANRNPAWINILAQAITMHHQKDNAHMFGAKFIWTLQKSQREVFAKRPWYHKQPWQMANGKPAPNADKVVFVAGGFWAISYAALVKADIPDLGTGLTNNGGDWQIGAQLWQNGFGTKAFNGGKQFVHTSSVPRRGATTPTPGAAPLPPPPPTRPQLVQNAPPRVQVVQPAVSAPAPARTPVIIEL